MFHCQRVRNLERSGTENWRASLFLSNVHKRFSNPSGFSKKNSSVNKKGSFVTEIKACMNIKENTPCDIHADKRKSFLELPDIEQI